MNFKQELEGLKKAIDKELGTHFDRIIVDAEKKDPLIAEALRQTKKIAISGGKRIRGALVCHGYFGAGGREKKKIMKVAVAIELVHLYLLVHDDIIDRGDLRHGEMTLHEFFAHKKKKTSPEEKKRFGDSVAIIVGDMLYVLANKLVAQAGFGANETVQALALLQDYVGTTIVGQSQDIAIENDRSVGEKEVLAMYENKTAKYTFESPLRVGMALAGCNDRKTFGSISGYAEAVGIAFQIQDDILGVFGSEKKIGKSVASDIEEGKQSLMVVKARQTGNANQKKQLASILGKKNVTKKEVAAIQTIIKETGALAYCQKMAKEKFAKGKQEIEKAILLKETKNFLVSLVRYLEGREI
ncbi:MAG TPA: polyprenyl synthetase family protein [Patescibacteria group bacterium]